MGGAVIKRVMVEVEMLEGARLGDPPRGGGALYIVVREQKRSLLHYDAGTAASAAGGKR